MVQNPEKRPSLDKDVIEKILTSVPYDRGFHFFRSVGNYTGETAINLFSFFEELKTIELQAVKFHFQRGDFQKWIRETLEDTELADRIDKIDGKLPDEILKKELLKVVQTRFEELQTLKTKLR
jgi:hypothetical protein